MLELEVKQLIIDVLRLEDLLPGDIDSTAPLFGDGLGLDSIDALELSVALQHKYGVELPVYLPVDTAATRDDVVSVRTLVALIAPTVR